MWGSLLPQPPCSLSRSGHAVLLWLKIARDSCYTRLHHNSDDKPQNANILCCKRYAWASLGRLEAAGASPTSTAHAGLRRWPSTCWIMMLQSAEKAHSFPGTQQGHRRCVTHGKPPSSMEGSHKGQQHTSKAGRGIIRHHNRKHASGCEERYQRAGTFCTDVGRRAGTATLCAATLRRRGTADAQSRGPGLLTG